MTLRTTPARPHTAGRRVAREDGGHAAPRSDRIRAHEEGEGGG